MKPIPESGNLIGALAILRKTDLELSGKTPGEKAASDIMFHAIKTKGDVKRYAAYVHAKVAVAKAIRNKK